MKPKLNPLTEKQEPIVSQLRSVNKLLQDIKLILGDANEGSNEVLSKGLEKLVEEATKQKKIMNRVRLAVQSKNQGQQGSVIGEKQHIIETQKKRIDIQPDKPLSMNDDIKQIVKQQNKLLEKQNDILKNTSTLLSSMGNMMMNLQSKMKGYQSNNQITNAPSNNLNSNQVQQFFKEMQLSLSNNPNDTQSIQKWVGQLFRIAAQEAFISYKKVQQDQVKITFSSFILDYFRKYIVKLSKINSVKIDTIEKIFYDSCKKTLQYLKFKFPQSKKKVSDMSLTQKIKTLSKKIQPESDLLRGGQIQLDFTNDKLLRSSVKAMINVLIKHGNQKFPSFKNCMLDIFQQTQKNDKQNTFRFLIGRKIKQSTPVYSQQQISSPGSFFKGNEILRVMMKWIEQLMEYFTKTDKIKQNRSGFKIQEDGQIKKLGIKDRDKIALIFEKKYQQLKKKLKQIQSQLRKTIINIILISENQITSKSGQELNFLNKEETSLLVICQYIYKSLESYVMDVIVSILLQFNTIKKQFDSTGQEWSDLQMYTLTIGDLFRCKCSGTKDQILKVYETLISKKCQNGQNKFKILRVKNRLNEGTQDILINFMLPKNESYFICQIQLALSTSEEEVSDHFNHFLYEQHRSNHGVITELGILLFNLDSRRSYILKNKLVFKNNVTKFILKNDQKMVCIDHQDKQLDKKQCSKYYVCNNCGRFIDAYRFYFDASQCSLCENNICPLCELQILTQPLILKKILRFWPKLNGYFQFIGKPLLNLPLKTVKQKIMSLLKQQKFVGVLSLKNNENNFQLNILKMLQKQIKQQEQQQQQGQQGQQGQQQQNQAQKQGQNNDNKQKQTKQNASKAKRLKTQQNNKNNKKSYVLTSFSNLEFEFNNLDDSIVFLLKPTNFSQLSFESYNNATQEQFQWFYSLQENFEEQKQYQQGLFVIQNTISGKKCLIDFKSKNQNKLFSQAKMNKFLSNIESKKTNCLVIDDFMIQHLNLLNDTKNSGQIQQIQLMNGEVDQQKDKQQQVQKQKYSEDFFIYLNMFKNTNILSITNSCYYNHLNFDFNINLTQLVIKDCWLKSFNLALVPKVCSINLSNNNLQLIDFTDLEFLNILNISNNNLVSLKNIQNVKLKLLNKLILTSNKLKQIPQINFPELKILDIQQNELENINRLLQSYLPKLKSLKLQSNSIKTLPNLQNLSSLSYLDLSYNNINSVLLKSQSHLQQLILNSNQIKQFPIFQSKELNLNLSYNKISQQKTIINLMGCMQNGSLNLVGNQIQSLPIKKTNLSYIVVEISKCKLQIDFWDQSEEVEMFDCYSCSKPIMTNGLYLQEEEEVYYCNDCYNNMEQDEQQELLPIALVWKQQIERQI